MANYEHDERVGLALRHGSPIYLKPADVVWLNDRRAVLADIRATVEACTSTRDWDRAHTRITASLAMLDRLDRERT